MAVSVLPYFVLFYTISSHEKKFFNIKSLTFCTKFHFQVKFISKQNFLFPKLESVHPIKWKHLTPFNVFVLLSWFFSHGKFSLAVNILETSCLSMCFAFPLTNPFLIEAVSVLIKGFTLCWKQMQERICLRGNYFSMSSGGAKSTKEVK